MPSNVFTPRLWSDAILGSYKKGLGVLDPEAIHRQHSRPRLERETLYTAIELALGAVLDMGNENGGYSTGWWAMAYNDKQQFAEIVTGFAPHTLLDEEMLVQIYYEVLKWRGTLTLDGKRPVTDTCKPPNASAVSL